jgi:arsenite-transporting ATPase
MGGVGKTRAAARAALASAAGVRTLLVTTDPAPSLADVLQAAVTASPRAVPGVAGLYAATVAAAAAFRRWLAPRRPLVAQIAVRGTYLDDEDVARLLDLSLPGVDEVIGLIEVVRLSRGFDAVFVDTAPTGHTLRLLASPALLGRVAALLDGVQAHHRAVVSALRGSYRADAADRFIAALRAEGDQLASLLRDPATQVSWVTLPEPMALEETADALDALTAAGIGVKRLIVNRITPAVSRTSRSGAGGCNFCEGRRRFEARAVAPLRTRFGGIQISAYPEVEHEPRGVRALRSLGRRGHLWKQPAPAPPMGRRVRPEFGKNGDTHHFSQKTVGVPVFGVAWLLFGGKGGVGKSTCAAATALRLARDRRVLLMSTDPAHSLGDVLGQRVDNTPRHVNGARSLFVREIDARAEMDAFRRRYVDAVDDAFARISRGMGGDRDAFRDLIDLAPPGIDEVIAIADVAEALSDGNAQYDAVVTDTAPTGHALRLLQTPAVLREWTQALMALLLKYREIVGAGSLAALLVQLSRRLRGLQSALTDATRSRFVVVTRPAALPMAESRDLIAALGGLGISVGAIVVNAVGRGTCLRCRRIARAQDAEIAQLTSGRAGYVIIEAPAEVPPPHGPAALVAWGSRWRQVTG